MRKQTERQNTNGKYVMNQMNFYHLLNAQDYGYFVMGSMEWN